MRRTAAATLSRNHRKIAQLVDSQRHISNSAFVGRPRLAAQLFQIDSIEALGEPVVDFREDCAGLVATAGIAQQSREAHGRAQFIGLRPHLLGEHDRLVKIGLGEFSLSYREPQLTAVGERFGPLDNVFWIRR